MVDRKKLDNVVVTEKCGAPVAPEAIATGRAASGLQI